MNGSEDNPCREAQLLVDRRLDDGIDSLTQAETDRLEAHLDSCQPCLRRQAQMREIVATAKAVPQFDISEALTQRILTSVERERSARASAGQVAWMVGLLAAGAGLFVVDSIESLHGIGSWCVGLAAMVLVKAVISETPRHKQAGR